MLLENEIVFEDFEPHFDTRIRIEKKKEETVEWKLEK